MGEIVWTTPNQSGRRCDGLLESVEGPIMAFVLAPGLLSLVSVRPQCHQIAPFGCRIPNN